MHFCLGNKLTNTHVRTEAETKGRPQAPVDIEHVGIFKDILVAIGRGDDARDHGTFGNRYPANLHVLGRLAHLEGSHRLKAHSFVDGLGHQVAVLANTLKQIRPLQQQGHERAEGAGSGFASGR
ncbi:hypothetical protein D3C81_1121120 [compost metagenome]